MRVAKNEDDDKTPGWLSLTILNFRRRCYQFMDKTGRVSTLHRTRARMTDIGSQKNVTLLQLVATVASEATQPDVFTSRCAKITKPSRTRSPPWSCEICSSVNFFLFSSTIFRTLSCSFPICSPRDIVLELLTIIGQFNWTIICKFLNDAATFYSFVINAVICRQDRIARINKRDGSMALALFTW